MAKELVKNALSGKYVQMAKDTVSVVNCNVIDVFTLVFTFRFELPLHLILQIPIVLLSNRKLAMATDSLRLVP